MERNAQRACSHAAVATSVHQSVNATVTVEVWRERYLVFFPNKCKINSTEKDGGGGVTSMPMMSCDQCLHPVFFFSAAKRKVWVALNFKMELNSCEMTSTPYACSVRRRDKQTGREENVGTRGGERVRHREKEVGRDRGSSSWSGLIPTILPPPSPPHTHIFEKCKCLYKKSDHFCSMSFWHAGRVR